MPRKPSVLDYDFETSYAIGEAPIAGASKVNSSAGPKFQKHRRTNAFAGVPDVHGYFGMTELRRIVSNFLARELIGPALSVPLITRRAFT